MRLCELDHVATGTERRMLRALVRQARRAKGPLVVSDAVEDVWYRVRWRAGYVPYADADGWLLCKGHPLIVEDC